MPDLRERLTFIARAMFRDDDLLHFESLTERNSRYLLCREALDCLGAYYRGEPLPPAGSIISRARYAIEQGNEVRGER